ncbi:MAG TPA: bifunctional [glutamate--ammonia ligase]-adenylyl-L-tyrosine phosphorylase/[glutamate--ammonia-ligase] adenylyltransferase [Nevskiaceae bacterium]|nr:bifunctional [glutamate--ammonia ligase]-adenylyl-L-tyrosine phosphorylase/[glutamate--ammonia-ligase] adenylyltransferase [Nevskiaceae bacterium]
MDPATLARCSPFLAAQQARFAEPPPRPDPQAEEPVLMRQLRDWRYYRLGQIGLAELDGPPALDQTLAALSDLADECLGWALDHAWSGLVARHGLPREPDGQPIPPVILGMGKLGGRELNFSSDIDLIFCHRAAGESDGERPLHSDEFFARLSQQVGRLLSQRTAEGFVFRVDTLLRPFGSAGPLSISFDAAEDYYQQHGREWERYALIKARPVAGDLAAGQALLARLRPFIYRRYLDFNAIASLRELKRLIAADAEARGLEDDVKVGPGGIRELEFIVQSFQLVRGGQDPRLRDPRLRPVLRLLGELGLLPAATATQLDADYGFLRRLENAIQFYADQQTHRLPVEPAPRKALALALGFRRYADLERRYRQVAARVQAEFQRVFSEPAGSPLRSPFQAVLAAVEDRSRAALALAPFGSAAEALAEEWAALLGSSRVRTLSESAARRLQALVPLLCAAAAEQAEPAACLRRLLAVLRQLLGRSTYLALLEESETARAQLVRLCAASPYIAEQLAATPALLDVLLDPRTLYSPPGPELLRRELEDRLAGFGVDETEAAMDSLRRYRHETSLRIAAADVSGQLPLVKVSDHLTWLAEAVIAAALARAEAELGRELGRPLRRDGQPAGFAVIGYGKLGGLELGYGSDLDLVFLHDCDALDEDSQGGQRAISNGVWFGRLVQRLVHWLSTLTAAGRAYEIDLELRPSGRSGLAVVSLEAFARYQREQAWTWEHQALSRARPVAGSRAVGQGFEQIREAVLRSPREPQRLRSEIAEMRQKMRRHLDRSSARQWDPKQGEGGLVDIEFLAQYLTLREGPRLPVLWPDTWRQLEAVAAAGALAPAELAPLLAAQRACREFLHRAKLDAGSPFAAPAAWAAHRSAVSRLYRAYLG